MVCSEGDWTNCSCNCIRRRRKSCSGVFYSSVAFKIYSFFSYFASKIFDSPDLINSATSVNYALDISFIVAFKALTLLNYASFT